MSPAALAAMRTVPWTVEHEARAVASAWLETVTVAEAHREVEDAAEASPRTANAGRAYFANIVIGKRMLSCYSIYSRS